VIRAVQRLRLHLLRGGVQVDFAQCRQLRLELCSFCSSSRLEPPLELADLELPRLFERLRRAGFVVTSVVTVRLQPPGPVPMPKPGVCSRCSCRETVCVHDVHRICCGMNMSAEAWLQLHLVNQLQVVVALLPANCITAKRQKIDSCSGTPAGWWHVKVVVISRLPVLMSELCWKPDTLDPLDSLQQQVTLRSFRLGSACRADRDSLLLQDPTLNGRRPTTLSLTMCVRLMHLRPTSASPIRCAAVRCDCVTTAQLARVRLMQVDAPRLRKSPASSVVKMKELFACEAHVVCHLPRSALCCHLLRMQGPGCRRGRHAAITPVCHLLACPTTCRKTQSYTYSSVCAIADLPTEAADRIAELGYIRKRVQLHLLTLVNLTWSRSR
jgi:hypothetical protein